MATWRQTVSYRMLFTVVLYFQTGERVARALCAQGLFDTTYWP